MARRAYSPRLSTAHLAARIRAREGIASVRIVPPVRPPSPTRPTLLRVTLTDTNAAGQAITTEFTIAQARAWLASEG